MVDRYSYYTTITVTITTETNQETGDTEEKKVVNKGYETNSYAGYYFKLADNFDNTNNSFIKVIGTIDYLGDDYFNNPDNKDPIYSDILNTQENHPFSGYFDGNKKTINVKINPTTNKDFVGLFGYTKDATITNLNVDGMVSGRVSVGGLVGLAYGGKISNIESDVNVSFTGIVNVSFTGINAGGIVGTYYIESGNYRNGEVRHVVNRGEVKYTPSGNDKQETEVSFGPTWTEDKLMIAYQGTRAGGIIGQSFHVQLTEAYNSGNVTARFGVGGIIGTMISQDDDISQDSVVNTAFNVGDVKATSGLGTNYTYNNDITTIYQVNAYVGGIVGRMYGASTLSNSMNVGNVTASWRGTYDASDPNDVKFTYNTTNPTVGGRGAGGIIGVTSIEIETLKGGNKYISSVINTGKVKAWSHVGGIAGILAYSDVSYSINVGVVEADGYITYKEGNYAFTGAIVGLGVAANLSATVAFDGDLSYKTKTDSIIQAIGDDGDESVVFGYSANSSLAAKLSSSHLICQPNNSKPYGLSSTFFDTGWEWQSYDTKETRYYYYPQLKSFSTATTIILKDNKSVSEISEEAVRLTIKDKPVTDEHRVTIILNLMNGSISDRNPIGINEDITFEYVYSENVWKAEGIPYKNYQQEGKTLDLEEIEAVMTYPGYDFKGWYLDEDYTEPPFDGYISSQAVQTLYAKWVPHQYNINLTGVVKYSNGNVELSNNENLSYTIEDTRKGNVRDITLPTIKENSAYKYEYWITTINTTEGIKTYNATSFSITEQDNGNYLVSFFINGVSSGQGTIAELQQFDFELYCSENNYNISFIYKDYTSNSNPTSLDGVTNPNLDSNNTTISFNINSTDGLELASKPGYKFIGWFYEGQKVNTISEILKILNKDKIDMKDVELEGRFEADTFKLILNLNGGTFAEAQRDSVKLNINGKSYSLERNNEGVWVIEVLYGTDITWLTNITLRDIKSPAGKTFIQMSSHIDTFENIVSNMPANDLTVYANYDTQTYKIKLGVTSDVGTSIDDLVFNDTDKNIPIDNGTLSWENNTLYLTTEYGADLSDALKIIQNVLNARNDVLNARNDTSYKPSGYEAKYDNKPFNYYNVKIDEEYTEISINFIYSQENFIVDFYDSLGNFIAKFETKGSQENWLKDNKIIVSELNNSLSTILAKYTVPTGYTKDDQYIIYVDDIPITITDADTDAKISVNGAYTRIVIQLTAKVYNVEFETDGTEVTETITFTYNEPITTLPESNRNGYDLEGWEYGGSLLAIGTIFNVDNISFDFNTDTKITLKARYKAATYNITYEFKANAYWAGNIPNQTQSVRYNGFEDIDLEEEFSDFEGYIFGSASYNNTNITNKIIDNTFLENLQQERNITITINLEIKTIYIIFNAGEGHFKFVKDDITRGFYLENKIDLSDSSKHITEDNGDNSKLKYLVIEANYYQRAVDALHNRPILVGYTYSSYIAEDNNINMNTPLTNEQNIFNANYNADTYTVTYIGEGITTETIKAKYNDEITLRTPTRTGYECIGWKIVGQTDYTIYEGEYTVKGNVVFEAKWEEKEFNLILTVDEKYQDKVLAALNISSWPNNNTFKIKFNTNLQALNRIEIDNSLLIWKSGNDPYTFSTMPADDLELTAELSQREYKVITAEVMNEKTKEGIFTFDLYAFKQNNGKYKIESILGEFDRDGYSFNINSVNWFDENANNIGNLANAEFTSHTTIYAYATPDPYTIVYTTYENGVLKTDTITGYHDQVLIDALKTIKENSSRPGYEFKNWTMNGIAVEDDKIITSNITVIADWTPVTYKIKYEYDSFNKTTEAIIYDSVINQIPTFSELNSGKEEAYYSMEFMVGNVSWDDIFGDDLRMVALNDIMEQYPGLIEQSDNEYINEYIITVTIELVAKNFTINFIGTNIGVPNFEEFSVPFNKESDFTNITNKINDGITISTSSFDKIKHYNCLKFGDVAVAESYDFEDLIKLFENQYDVEVRLEYEPKTYYLVYGEEEEKFNITKDNVNIDEFKPTYSGTDDAKHYYFAGWYINGDTNETLYKNIIPVNELLNYIKDGKVEILPKYEPRNYGIIFYDKPDNSLDTSLPYGTKLDSNNLKLDLVLKDNEGNYEFKGWEYNNIKYLVVDGKIDLSSLTVNGHMLFNAIWEAKEFTITYNNIDGLTNPNPSTITIETNQLELKDIYKLGYTFEGWYFENTYQGQVVKVLDLKTISNKDNINLYAKFTPNTYKVTFDTIGGQTVEDKEYRYDDDSFTGLPSTEKDGYRFVGWYYGNIHIQTLADIATYAIDNKITLTAVYEDNTYKIKFAYQYGQLTDSNIENKEVSLGYSDLFNLPGINNLSDDYQFLYWKVEIDGVTTYYQAGQMISRLVTTGEVTFTAIYSYKVKLYDDNTLKYELNLVLDETSVTLPSLPDKEHYTFKGWTTGNDSKVYVAGENYSVTKPLYAKYDANTYTITYEIHDENNNIYHYDIVNYTYSENNQQLKLKDLPTKSDLYKYDGWYLDDEKVEDINTVYGQNVTLYAKRTTNDITTTIVINDVPNVDDYKIYLEGIKNEATNVDIQVSNNVVTVKFTTKYNESREIINNFFGSSYSVTSEGINYTLDKLNINLTTPSKNEKYELSFYTGSVKVTLYLDKGTSEPKIIGTLNELVITEGLVNDRLTNIDTLGYEFKGWKVKDSNEEYVDYSFTNDELTKALELYALYEAISYTISYDDTNISDQTVAFDDGKNVETLNVDGQELLGWSLTEGGPVHYSAGESINNVLREHLTNETNLMTNENIITLYPVTREYYLTINFDKFDSNATGNMSSIKVSYSDLNGYVLPANKYELVGNTSTSWKYDESFANITEISDDLLTTLQNKIASNDASINLIANWKANKYSVTYINATITNESTFDEYTYGNGLTLPALNDLAERSGFTFDGWFMKRDYTGDEVTTINNNETGNKTYYAKWTPNKYYLKFEKSETIKYVDANGNEFKFSSVTGEGLDTNFYYLEVTYGSSIPELPILEETNYIFHAWTYNNVTISEGNVYSYVSNITLTANKSKQPYTIFIDFDNGDQNINKVTEYGASINEYLDKYRNITKTGYTLTGWKINGTSYTLEQLKQNELAITSSTTIKAVWTPNKYDLIINGKTYEDYLTFGQNKPLQEVIDELTKDGYQLGFTDEKNSQDVKYTNSYKLENASDITLYPIWEANTLTIIFNNNNGSGTMKQQDVSYDQLDNFELTENTFTKRGHDFIGWLYNSDQSISFNNGKLNLTEFIIYVKEQLKNENFTIELEANWQASKYYITYEFGELTDVINPNEKTYTYGIGLTLETPSKTGYTFIGWKVNNNDVVKEYVIGEDTIGDITLQGVFEPNTYTITYEFGELTDVINPNQNTYTYGEGLILKDPSRLGYTFDGWYLNNVKVNEISTTTIDDLILEGRFTPIEYTISFNSDGGTNIEEVKYEYGKELSLPEPSKAGYTFIGWYFNDEVVTPDIIAQNAIDNAITLTARYEANYIKITITISDIATSNLAAIINRELNNNLKGYEFTISESNDGAVITITISIKYSPNEDISGLNNIINTTTHKENDITYTFGGYKSNNQSYQFNDLPTEDINITANYLTSEMIVYLYVDDNAPISYIPKLEDGKYSLTKQELDEEISTKIGYTLSAWYDQNGDEFNFSIEQNKSISLYAKFIPNTYAITLNVNGGDELSNDKIEVTYDSPIGDNLVEPTRDGYTFVGWYYNDVLITADTKYTYTFNIELKAQWEANKYFINFIGEGVVLTAEEYTYDISETLNVSIPRRLGYTFDGWLFGSKTYNNDDTIFNLATSGEINFEAQWQAISYTIVLNPGDSSGEAKKENVLYEESYEFPECSYNKEGYTFGGWLYNGQIYAAGDVVSKLTTEAHAEITFVAKFVANTYNVIFNNNGGIGTMLNQEYKYDETKALITNSFNRTGYKFIGWATNEDSDVVYDDSEELTYKVTKDTILYAVWEANTYTIDFKLDSSLDIEVELPKSVEIKYNASFNLTELNVTGYRFIGWYYEEQQIISGMPYTYSEDITLIARFELDQYNIYFDMNGGNPIDSMNVAYGENVKLTTTPTRVGYTFAGFSYNNNTYSLAEDLTIEGFTVPQTDATLKAIWTVNTYTITLNDGGELTNDKVDVTYDSQIGTNLVDPTRTGYAFIGWFDSNNNRVTKETIYNYANDITLTAQWEAMTYVITYETVGGSTINEVLEMTYDKPSHITNTIPTRRGYNFLGFATTPNAEEAIYSSGQEVTNILFETSNKTLYAVWEAKTYTISYQGYSNTQTFSYNEVLPELLEVSLEGNTFISWYYNNIRVESGQLLSALLTDEDEKDLNITLVPRFEKNSYIVSFDTLGGTNIEAINVTYGDSINIDNPTKTGYNFISWQIDGDDVDLATYKMPDHNVKLVARYEIVEYNISYVGTDYSHSNKETYTVEDVVEFEDATKVGYTFAGWYLDSNFETKVTSTLDYAKDLVLYAKFEVITYFSIIC